MRVLVFCAFLLRATAAFAQCTPAFTMLDPVMRNASTITPFYFVAADVNGDLRRDIIMTTGTLNVSIAQSSGGYVTSEYALPSSFSRAEFVAEDLNGDGFPDIAIYQYPQVAVYINDKHGVFTPLTPQTLSPANYYYSLATGDFDGDGKKDLLFLSTSPVIAVFYGRGDGTFNSSAAISPTTTSYVVVALGDMDGDKRLDAVVFSAASGRIDVFRGLPNGFFALTGVFIGNFSAPSVTLGDLDGDGDLDIVTGSGGARLTIIRNDGTGHLLAPTTIALLNSVGRVWLGDFNGDRKLDIVTADYAAPFYFLGHGDATFDALKTVAPYLSNTFLAAVADLNGDGISDLIYSDTTTSKATIIARVETTRCSSRRRAAAH